jgi:penicillin-binding protein 2
MDYRFSVIKGLVIAIFALLILRIGYLQLYQSERYFRRAEENRLRLVEIDPQRGFIFDCKGRLLVDNDPSYSIVGSPKDILDNLPSLQLLSEILNDTSWKEWERNANRMKNRAEEVKLKRDIDFASLASFEENHYFLPGIELKIESKRRYQFSVGIHLLGYLGEIGQDELTEYKGLLPGDLVGKGGIEKIYNRYLYGRKGLQALVVDASGRRVGDVQGIKEIPPVNGDDLYLTIDLDLQLLAEELLAGENGAIVALNPTNGDILAMVSVPEYDPAVFSGVMEAKAWEALLNHPGKPLLNRAIQGVYPPGSTIKMAIICAALEEGVTNTERVIVCHGSLQMGNRVFKCWKAGGHGKMSALSAIEQSCDVYFYKMGLELGIENMAKYAKQFGFGSTTKIDLEGEYSGLVPDSAYMDRRYGKGNWSKGQLMNIAIGQGEYLVTPLQLAIYGISLANAGKIPTPHLLKGIMRHNPDYWIDFEPKIHYTEGISPQTYEIVRRGMFEVVQGAQGTAHWLMDPDWEIAGKTGTAQNPHGEDHAWFIGFAPFDEPQIVACALVEHGEHGSSAAAPIVFKIIQKYLKE